MEDILDKILRQRAADVAAAKAVASRDDLTLRAQSQHPTAPLDLYEVVCRRAGLSIAAEFKRASPSKGAIARPGLDVAVQLDAYMAGGADVLSVLTEPAFFQGSLADLELARRLADCHGSTHGSRPAILRKDFIIDTYQLDEARAWGADTALLIVAALPPEQLPILISASRALGMEPLVEVCCVRELDEALAAGADVIGVNNRNLRTFTLDMGTTAAVVAAALKRWGSGVTDVDAGSSRARHRFPVVLSLSGIKEAADLLSTVDDCASRTVSEREAGTNDSARLMSCLRGFLIGEALMRSSDPEGMVCVRAWHVLRGSESPMCVCV
jgi:indole-3-glycerol phosphate synthase